MLWGAGGASVEALAAPLGTIGYELLCRVTPRVRRVVAEVSVGGAEDETASAPPVNQEEDRFG